MEYTELRKKGVYLGRAGEDGKRTVWLDVTAWNEQAGGGSGVLLYTSPKGQVWPLGTKTETDETTGTVKLSAPITLAETAAAGIGHIEAQWMSGGEKVKSQTFNTLVLESAYTGETVPDKAPHWVQELIEELNAAGMLLEELGEVASEAHGAYEEIRGTSALIDQALTTAEGTVAQAQEYAEAAEGHAGNANDYKTAAAASATAAAASAEQAMDATPDGYAAFVASMAGAYSAASGYAVGDYVLKDGQLYKCNTAIDEEGETWTAAHWTAVTAAGQLSQLSEDVVDLKDAVYGDIDLTDNTWVSGYYNQNTGGTGSSSQWTRNSVLIPIVSGTIITMDSTVIKSNVVVYSKSTASTANFISGITLETDTYTIPADGYLGLSLRYVDTSKSVDVSEMLTHIKYTPPSKIEELIKKLAVFDTVYVSADGSDDNQGTQSAPFKTVYKAASVSNNIVLLPGKYTERIALTAERQTLNISAFPSADPADVVFFDLSDFLVCETVTNGVAYIPFNAGASDFMTTVFVTKTQSLTAGQSAALGKDYRCQLWSDDGNTQYIPVVGAVSDLQNGQWTYDGTNIMIKGGTAGNYRLASRAITGNILNIENVSNLVISGIKFGYTYRSIAVVKNCQYYVISNCEFSHSSIANGIELGKSNGTISKCASHHNCNDGFSFHDDGHSTTVDCSGYDNAAGDGISHHECCAGTIIGGNWYRNGKAGISDPTYGADINIYSAYCHHNAQYGIQVALSSGGGINNGDTDIIVSNCVMANNPVGISVSGYTVDLIAPIYKENTTDSTTSGGGVINEF